MARVVYFSNVSENTHRFVQKLDVQALRIPVLTTDAPVFADEEYILITPSYGTATAKAVPKQVVRFLNDEANRSLMVGVISSGNRNFGREFALAGPVVAKRCGVPLLHRFEISGTPDDVQIVLDRLDTQWP